MITFKETGLSDSILKSIEALGFVNPTPIQEKTIPYLLESERDIIGLAQTGTGKTAAFGLPIIEKCDTSKKAIQALILAPTRELCIQITKEMELYALDSNNLRITSVYGGASITNQMDELKRGVHIVAATPGRALDLIKRKALRVNAIQYLVLDEADEMLNMGFKDELDGILENTPAEKQTLLFSATMPKEVQRIADNYLKDPVEISAGEKNKGAENVNHEFYMGLARNRYEILKRVVDVNPDIYGIVFCRTRRETKEVADKLMADGYNADALHGDLSQAQRETVMGHFRSRHLQMLVATDVAARGLDVNDLTHVINYNLPDEKEIYIHRSGRTGRAGKKGVSVTIIHTREMHKIKDLEKVTGKRFNKKMIPNGEEICAKQLYKLIDRMEKVEVDEERIEPFMPTIYKKLEWLDKEQLIKHFVSLEFNRFLEYYKNRGDLNVDPKKERDDRGRGERGRERERERFVKSGKKLDFERFFISVGSGSGLTKPKLIGLINDTTEKRNIEIGKIDLMKNFSFFEIDKTYTELLLKKFNTATYQGAKVVVEKSKPDQLAMKKERRRNEGDWNSGNKKGGYDKFKKSKKPKGKKRK